ncbi:MAG TPA: hypothetical protein VF171_07180 [Trueperaceae bacterium]
MTRYGYIRTDDGEIVDLDALLAEADYWEEEARRRRAAEMANEVRFLDRKRAGQSDGFDPLGEGEGDGDDSLPF